MVAVMVVLSGDSQIIRPRGALVKPPGQSSTGAAKSPRLAGLFLLTIDEDSSTFSNGIEDNCVALITTIAAVVAITKLLFSSPNYCQVAKIVGNFDLFAIDPRIVSFAAESVSVLDFDDHLSEGISGRRQGP